MISTLKTLKVRGQVNHTGLKHLEQFARRKTQILKFVFIFETL